MSPGKNKVSAAPIGSRRARCQGLLVGHPGEHLDDPSEHDVTAVAVRPQSTGCGDQGQVGERRHVSRQAVITAPAGEVLVEAVTVDPCGVRQDLPAGQRLRHAGVGEAQVGKVLAHRRIEIETALVDELHDRRCRVRLADRARLEQGLPNDRQTRVEVGDSTGGNRHFAVGDDAAHRAWNAAFGAQLVEGLLDLRMCRHVARPLPFGLLNSVHYSNSVRCLTMAAVRLTRKEKQQQTRAAILDAAITLFAKHGVEGTSMEAIARHAGLTQGAIYSNFTGKADLWWAIGDQMSRTLDLSALFGANRPLREELADVGRAVWQLLRTASRTELLLSQEFDLYLMRHPRERAKYAREARGDQRQLAALLERGAADRGESLPMDARRLAGTIESTAFGLLHTFMLDRRAVDEELCVGAFTSLAG